MLTFDPLLFSTQLLHPSPRPPRSRTRHPFFSHTPLTLRAHLPADRRFQLPCLSSPQRKKRSLFPDHVRTRSVYGAERMGVDLRRQVSLTKNLGRWCRRTARAEGDVIVRIGRFCELEEDLCVCSRDQVSKVSACGLSLFDKRQDLPRRGGRRWRGSPFQSTLPCRRSSCTRPWYEDVLGVVARKEVGAASVRVGSPVARMWNCELSARERLELYAHARSRLAERRVEHVARDGRLRHVVRRSCRV